jgi:hypothetical protein
MTNIIDIQSSISKIKYHSQELRDEISSVKEQDVSSNYYLGNLKRLSLQALDLFNAMQKQISFLNNQKRFLAIRENTQSSRPKRRELHGISME